MRALFRGANLYLLLLLPLIYFAFFLRLDSLPFRMWDESFEATNTYDMMHDHDYIVTHSFDHPDMYITKPPLVLWCMTASCKVVGFNELGIRLPNAIISVLFCFFLFFLLGSISKDRLAGFAAVLMLITSSGYTCLHVVRSGEYDCFLTTFVVSYCLLFFLITEGGDARRQKWIWGAFTLALICAILTKGIAALLIMPALPLYALLRKKLLWLLRSKETYLCLFSVVLIAGGYYILREHCNPGYLKAVFENELGGRFLKTNEGHSEAASYYLGLIATKYFVYGLPFILIGLIFSFLPNTDRRTARFIQFCMLMAVVLTTVLSISATKLAWYCAPVLPFLAIISGLGVAMIIRAVFNAPVSELQLWKKGCVVAFLTLIFIVPYSKVIGENENMSEKPWDVDYHAIGHYVKHKLGNNESIDGYKILMDPDTYRISMCETRMLAERGQHVKIILPAAVAIGDTMIIRIPNDKPAAEKLFSYKVIERYQTVEIWQISGYLKQ